MTTSSSHRAGDGINDDHDHDDDDDEGWVKRWATNRRRLRDREGHGAFDNDYDSDSIGLPCESMLRMQRSTEGAEM